MFTYWLLSEDKSVRFERNKRNLKKENNDVLPYTPTASTKFFHGKIKGSPKAKSPPTNEKDDSFNFQEASILDLLRESDSKMPRSESPKRFLPTPFQNDTSSNYSTGHGYNSSYLGVKLPANGLMTDLKGRSASGIELASPTKQADINHEPNERVNESDALLVRHYSLGHKMRWKPSGLSSEEKSNNSPALKIKITSDNNSASETSCV